MNHPTVLTVATAPFESARNVDVLPFGHRSRNLHGHSFRASVFAPLEPGWFSLPGADVPELEKHLAAVLAPLDYTHLNRVISPPTDENIARWVQANIDLPRLNRVAVQSTQHQGVDIDSFGTAHVWRRYRFEAAHQLPNVPPGHKCGRMHGHGFEVIVHANTDLGGRDLSVDYGHLDRIWLPFHNQLHYHCLNDIPGLENPTSELIAQWLWKELKQVLPELSWVTVYETASCGANFDGANFRIWKDFSLDSAVQVRGAPEGTYPRRIHGHTFTLRLHLASPLDKFMGWTVDFGDVKDAFNPAFKAFDHHPLHENPDIPDGDTRSVALAMYSITTGLVPQVTRLDLYETPGCGIVVAKDLNGPTMPM